MGQRNLFKTRWGQSDGGNSKVSKGDKDKMGTMMDREERENSTNRKKFCLSEVATRSGGEKSLPLERGTRLRYPRQAWKRVRHI